jgi:hypothetical protein
VFVVNKVGKATLAFNDDFNLKTFNVYKAIMNFGDGLIFYGAEVYFAIGVFVNMKI